MVLFDLVLPHDARCNLDCSATVFATSAIMPSLIPSVRFLLLVLKQTSINRYAK